MSLEALLRKAAGVGGRELHLAPARKITIVTDDGERQFGGPEMTAEMIEQVIAPVVSPDARAALASGRAEWNVKHRELGMIRVVAEQKSATFFMSPPEAPVRLSLVTSDARPTAEMDSLFMQMFEMKASDLHLCAGSPPIVRHDGDVKPMPGRAALSGSDVERILWPIAPERNREEFARRHDTDFACKKIGGGRVPALEVLIATQAISNLIRESKIFQIPSVIQTSKKQGMCLMNDSLLDLVRRKIVAPQEAYAKAVDKAALAGLFSANGIDL